MRRIVPRALAGLFAVGWVILPGFGAVDLSVTWSSEWPQVLEAGWGLYFTVLVGAAFVLVAVRPRECAPAVLQLVVAAFALAVSALAAREAPLAWFVALLGIETAIVWWLSGDELGSPWAARPRLSGPLLFIAGIGVGPWLFYAVDMWARNREGRSDNDVSVGIDHYSVQGSVGLALVLLTLLAALSRDARPFVPVCAGIVASYLGLVSLAWPDAAGGLSTGWSSAAIAWGLALVGAALLPPLRAADMS